MKYFKRSWEQSRGDEYDDWGTSVWFLEVHEGRWLNRQLQIYENGNVLSYDESHDLDEYGGLGDQEVDLVEFAEFEIDADQFEQQWQSAKPLNRGG